MFFHRNCLVDFAGRSILPLRQPIFPVMKKPARGGGDSRSCLFVKVSWVQEERVGSCIALFTCSSPAFPGLFFLIFLYVLFLHLSAEKIQNNCKPLPLIRKNFFAGCTGNIPLTQWLYCLICKTLFFLAFDLLVIQVV